MDMLAHRPLSSLPAEESFRSRATNTATKPSRKQTFTKFNDLPKELRLQIWELAIPGPRLVYLSSLSTFKSHAPVPSLILACKESFEVASRRYSRTASGRCGMRETYFDFERDILFVDLRSFGQAGYHAGKDTTAWKAAWARTTPHRRSIQNLCLGTDSLDYYVENGYEAEVIATLACFGDLKTLTLAIDHTVIPSKRATSSLEFVDIPGVEDSLGHGMDQPVPANFGYSPRTFSLNSEWMKNARLRWFQRHGEQLSWELPKFRYKKVVSVKKPRSAKAGKILEGEIAKP